jgi:hypothetical protein
MAISKSERWERAAAAGLILLAALALWLFQGTGPQDDLRAATERIKARIAPGELVLLHPPGNAVYLDCLEGLPVLASATLKRADLAGVAGVWLVTTMPRQALRTHKVLGKAFKKGGRAEYDSVTLHHFWAPRPQEKP